MFFRKKREIDNLKDQLEDLMDYTKVLEVRLKRIQETYRKLYGTEVLFTFDGIEIKQIKAEGQNIFPFQKKKKQTITNRAS